MVNKGTGWFVFLSSKTDLSVLSYLALTFATLIHFMIHFETCYELVESLWRLNFLFMDKSVNSKEAFQKSHFYQI